MDAVVILMLIVMPLAISIAYACTKERTPDMLLELNVAGYESDYNADADYNVEYIMASDDTALWYELKRYRDAVDKDVAFDYSGVRRHIEAAVVDVVRKKYNYNFEVVGTISEPKSGIRMPFWERYERKPQKN